VAVEGALRVRSPRPRDVRADRGDDGRAKGDVGHEVPVHDVDVQPIGVVGDGLRAFGAEIAKVGGEDGGGDDGGGSHDGGGLWA